MCHNNEAEGEGTDTGTADRFVVYSVAQDEHLPEEQNFEETMPREVNRPLFLTDEHLQGRLK